MRTAVGRLGSNLPINLRFKPMSSIENPLLQTRGRPVGSGAQLPAADRTRKSRVERSATGAVRIDFSLDPGSAIKLTKLMAQWQSTNRKEAIQQAIDIVHASVFGETRREG
jgi:hypothetical protein